MKIIIGSARIDENGHLSGGKMGDQTGKEVSEQEFYIHSKGWVILRAKDPKVAANLAYCMKRACNNTHIGYNQALRHDIWKEGTGSRVDTCCDCSSLLRQCVKEASGVDPGNFTTVNEKQVLLATGLFEEITYTKDILLYEGDVLVTKTKGHTAIVTEGHERTETIAPISTAKTIRKSDMAAFIAQITPLAQKQAANHDYKLYPSVTIAQAILESGWGTAKRMIAANAMFGVKVGSGKRYGKAWKGVAYFAGTTEYYDGKTATRIKDYFRQYESLEDSICDYMDLLCSLDRYRGAVNARSPEESIRAIVSGGYATGPNYASKVISIIC